MGKQFIPIWFFIGAILVFYGALILGSAIYELFVPSSHSVAMSDLHLGLRWGGGMLILGLAYAVRYRPTGKQM